jgi:hypothetical protein
MQLGGSSIIVIPRLLPGQYFAMSAPEEYEVGTYMVLLVAPEKVESYPRNCHSSTRRQQTKGQNQLGKSFRSLERWAICSLYEFLWQRYLVKVSCHINVFVAASDVVHIVVERL